MNTFANLPLESAFRFDVKGKSRNIFTKVANNKARDCYGVEQWVAPKKNTCAWWDQSMTVEVV